ncbi:hypothetical protein SODALDRAFT_333625 [Sodiomyces alkalinus F11]|uniref:Uncharacterized protein n=1 Tax=Sodiomyces alkalinus (strain CBS 110278 / VKM F-3762 / F11) TaxID=1314773 RepID=A0A3N2PTU8_SODAK|nr:hypothetical protein SODALDRAFT_333625 [Sodiomyces alkalinus F11]ROT37864.1 hypothetical protein SODALDRAFT_333625 [Sodiomyces alkalinus F11]
MALPAARMLVKMSLLKQLYRLLVPPPPGRKNDDSPTAEPPSFDKAWNMVSLTPQLCSRFRNAIFGLKWVEPNDLTLSAEKLAHGDGGDYLYYQVEWCEFPESFAETLRNQLGPWESARPRYQTIDLGCKRTIDALREYTKAFWAVTRPVKPERILTLKVKRGDYKKTELMIRTQWVLMQMAAFSGAGDVRKLIPLTASKLPGDPEPARAGCGNDSDSEREDWYELLWDWDFDCDFYEFLSEPESEG